MEEFSLTTPTLLFSAVSLIMLAYTNRFLSYAQLVRNLKDQYIQNRSEVTAAQIENLRKRLYLTRNMQILGISSLFFCVVSMFLVYIHLRLLSVYVFGFALLLLIASLGVSIRELVISVKALELHLKDMDSRRCGRSVKDTADLIKSTDMPVDDGAGDEKAGSVPEKSGS